MACSYEDDKFAKVRAASRLVGELEALQDEVEAASAEVTAAADGADRVKSERSSIAASLEAQVRSLDRLLPRMTLPPVVFHKQT